MEEWSKRCAQYRPGSGALTAMVGKYLSTLGQLDHLLTKCRKGDLVVMCHLKAKCAHPWLAERCREHLVVKCQLMAKSGHPWLAERRKGDLVVKGLFEGKERPSLACGTF